MQALLTLSLGPVQDFIAAARRTGDLHAGSQLLVEAAKRAAQTLEQQGGELIFPSSAQEDGPNRLLAQVPADRAEAIAAATRDAVQSFLRSEWEAMLDELRGEMADRLDRKLADDQLATFLEFYAAWWPLDGDYPRARAEVERLLAGRKALRDFGAAPRHGPGRPKSPLDPSRECVLRCDPTLAVPSAFHGHPFWLKKRETLDAVSLWKRWRGTRERDSAPSTAMMAARAILPAARMRTPNAVKALEQQAAAAGAGIDLGDLFFPERWDEWSEEERRRIDETVCKSSLKELLRALHYSESPPYYAILVADGDRMGKLIGAQPTLDRHRELSRALSQFAGRARARVATHDGHLIYCGGDDVLALLPVPTALRCAADLAREFRSALQGFAPPEAPPSLSAGIAIVHSMEPLQISLERARAAEHAAKQQRNALAIALHTRGGSPILAVEGWGNDVSLECWERFVEAFRTRDGTGHPDRSALSRGVPYELRELAREFEGLPLNGARLRAEAERIFRRKKGGSAEHPLAAGPTLRLPDEVQDTDSLRQCVHRMLIGRFLATYPEVPA